MEASNIVSDDQRALAQAVMDHLESLPIEAGDPDAAQLIDAMGAVGCHLATGPEGADDVRLRDTLIAQLRGSGVENVSRVLGQALHQWLALDHDIGVGTPPRQPDYPYQDGGVTVLGPEIFADVEKRIVCYRGVNYIPQDEADRAPISELPSEDQA